MSARRARLCGAVAMAAGFAFVSIGFALGASLARADAKGAVAQLAGRWKLNKERSDDEQAKTAATAAEPQAGATASGTTPGQPGATGRHGGGRERSSPAAPPTAPDNDPRGAQRTPEPTADLTITQSEVDVTVTDAPGQSHSFYPNGKTYKTDDGASDIKSQWKDGSLVVEKKNVNGWRMVETWHLSADGRVLEIDRRVEGGRWPKLTVKRVYDRVNAGR